MFRTYDDYLAACCSEPEPEAVPPCDACGADADDVHETCRGYTCRECLTRIVSGDRMRALIVKIEGFGDPDGDLAGAWGMLSDIDAGNHGDGFWDDLADWYEVLVTWGIDERGDYDY